MDFTYNRLKLLLDKLKSSIVKQSAEIDGFSFYECPYCAIGERPDLNKLVPYDGGNWVNERGKHFWFYKKVSIPEGFSPRCCEIAVQTCADGWFFGNPQFIVYIDNEIKNTLDWQHTSFSFGGKRNFTLSLYGYIEKYIPGGCERECCIPGEVTFKATIIEKDLAVNKLVYDIRVVFDALSCIATDSPYYFDILNTLTNVFDVIDFRRLHSEEFNQSIKQAQTLMDEFYKKQKVSDGPLVTLLGQTHIDVAWLWTKRQVREKAIRSFTTALDLLDKYPDFIFMQSQPVLYQYVKQDAPELYSRIQNMVKRGKWETEGALWVESDCNMISGESMVRQICYGKRFFKEEFGTESKVAWLPDTFGFSGALPQIFKKCGVTSFVTSKLTWNEVDTMPYDSFTWKGIDGSKIFGYFLTAQDYKRDGKKDRLTIYNARLTVPQVFGVVDRYEPKRINNDVILTHGFGDGGGGPTPEYLEYAERLNRGINGIPRTENGTLGGFMNKLVKKIGDNPLLPEWTGELYFEHHRGVYTSIAKIKRDNRKAEMDLMAAEIAATTANVVFGTIYPKDELEVCWKKVLTNQFHDVLPGSSISDVYWETDVEYQIVKDSTLATIEQLQEKLAENIKKDKFLLFNPNNAVACDYALYDGKYYKLLDLPAKGYKVVDNLDDSCAVIVGDYSIENQIYKVCFDENFEIISIVDKRFNRELIKKDKKANAFVAFEDYPGACDAWEIQAYYRDKRWAVNNLVSVEKVFEGARAGFKITRNYMDSVIEQTITLYDGGERIDFETDIDWHENNTVLKIEFPLDINYNKTVADAQFGYVERSVCRNTSWDEARFETCAHKFFDVSENGYGVSILNDCKYGYDALEDMVSLTALKCASFPFPDGDKCRHLFTYSIFAHEGGINADVYTQAYSLNNPVRICKTCGRSDKVNQEFSLCSTDKPNVIIETIKKAFDDDSIVVRLFEATNLKTEFTVNFGFNAVQVEVCDLLENPLEVLPVKDNAVKLIAKPFEIITLKIKTNIKK